MSAYRLGFPACVIDPAYRQCASEAIAEDELVKNFERLRGVSMARDGESAMRAFCEFVHADIYMRLPDEAIESLRATAPDLPA